MKVLVGAFNQEKVLVGAFSVIVKTDGSFAALLSAHDTTIRHRPRSINKIMLTMIIHPAACFQFVILKLYLGRVIICQ